MATERCGLSRLTLPALLLALATAPAGAELLKLSQLQRPAPRFTVKRDLFAGAETPAARASRRNASMPRDTFSTAGFPARSPCRVDRTSTRFAASTTAPRLLAGNCANRRSCNCRRSSGVISSATVWPDASFTG